MKFIVRFFLICAALEVAGFAIAALLGLLPDWPYALHLGFGFLIFTLLVHGVWPTARSVRADHQKWDQLNHVLMLVQAFILIAMGGMRLARPAVTQVVARVSDRPSVSIPTISKPDTSGIESEARRVWDQIQSIHVEVPNIEINAEGHTGGN